jgi:hypothetical protein
MNTAIVMRLFINLYHNNINFFDHINNTMMKRVKRSKSKNATKFIRIDAYTWIEKRIDEPDEVTRQKFLAKLSGFLDSPSLRPIY